MGRRKDPVQDQVAHVPVSVLVGVNHVDGFPLHSTPPHQNHETDDEQKTKQGTFAFGVSVADPFTENGKPENSKDAEYRERGPVGSNLHAQIVKIIHQEQQFIGDMTFHKTKINKICGQKDDHPQEYEVNQGVYYSPVNRMASKT